MNEDSRAIPPALEARELDVPFGRDPGLSHISFRVEPGERFALVGASGTGKTSLLRAVSGTGPLSSGAVLVEGREVTTEPPERRGMVLLSQQPLLFPHLSVFENVAFPLRVRGVSRKEANERVREVLDFVRLEGFGPRRPQGLSGGQAHRVALARAVAARPPVLLLDEPLTSLDPALREEVREAILAVQEEYRPAMILVTHDLQEAGRMAHRIGVMLKGTLAQVAPPPALFRNPASPAVARAVGIPNSVEGFVTPEGVLVLDGWPLSPAGSVARVDPAPGLRGRRVLLAFGTAAGHLALRGSGGIPARVAQIRHHPEGATARVTILPAGAGTGFRSRGISEGTAPTAEGPEPRSGASVLIAMDADLPLQLGEEVELVLDPARIHVFGE